MPRRAAAPRRSRRYARKTKRRRRFGFRRRKASRRVVDKSHIVNLRYTTYLDLDPSGSVPFVYNAFAANGVYDPDITGTGHQPYGYDQWSTFYPTWIVLGSKIRVKMVSADTNAPGIPAFFGVSLNNNLLGAWGASQTALIEQPNTSWRFIQTGPNSQPSRSATQTYSPRKWWGLVNARDVQGLWGQTNNNPADITYFNVWAAAADGSSNIGAIRGIVTIDYRVMFKNPNLLVTS